MMVHPIDHCELLFENERTSYHMVVCIVGIGRCMQYKMFLFINCQQKKLMSYVYITSKIGL